MVPRHTLGKSFHMGIDGLCVFDPRTRDTQLFVSRTHLGDFQVGSRAYIFSDNSDGKALVVVSYEPQDPENQWIAHVLLMKEQYAILMQQKVRACVRACVRSERAVHLLRGSVLPRHLGALPVCIMVLALSSCAPVRQFVDV